MSEKYLQRGVSAGKEEVHEAVKKLNHGLFPKAFCKIYPDLMAGDPAFCNIMSADGSGTKSVLAYLYWKETGDLSVWAGIAQDAIVMNLDDLLCVGATDNFLLTSVINRNKFAIPGEVLSAIINGTKQFIEKMAAYNVHINLMGGETADLGDIVRTVTVDAAMTARLPQNELILTDNIAPGDVIIGLSSAGQTIYEDEYNSGISSNGLTSARHDLLSKYYAEKYPETFDTQIDSSICYSGNSRLTDILPNTEMTIGKALLSPTRTFAPFIQELKKEAGKTIHAIINNTGGAQTKVLHYIRPLHIVKDNLLPIPPLFSFIQKESATDWREMWKVLNCGTRMEIYTTAAEAAAIISLAKKYGIAAQCIGYVAASEKAMVSVHHNGEVYQYE